MLASIGGTFAWIEPASAIDPVDTVYRADDRNIHTIRAAGGMYPRSGDTPDPDLLHHFEGESVDGHHSAFVSTSSSLREVIRHAASLARPNSEEPFDEDYTTYIYAIRPDNNFYNVRGSLEASRARSGNEATRARLTTLIADYADMDEWVALGGFSSGRIMRYAAITGYMLAQHFDSGAMFTDQFWTGRWTDGGTHYDTALDQQRSSPTPYEHVGSPRGYATVVLDGDRRSTPLSFSCAALSPGRPQRRSVSLDDPCFTYLKVRISDIFYDPHLLYAVFF